MPAAAALPPLRHRRCVAAVFVLVAATLIVVVATAVATVAATPRMPWLKSTHMLAAGARMGGSKKTAASVAAVAAAVRAELLVRQCGTMRPDQR